MQNAPQNKDMKKPENFAVGGVGTHRFDRSLCLVAGGDPEEVYPNPMLLNE